MGISHLKHIWISKNLHLSINVNTWSTEQVKLAVGFLIIKAKLAISEEIAWGV